MKIPFRLNRMRIPKLSTLVTQLMAGGVGAATDFALFVVLINFVGITSAFLMGIVAAILVNYGLSIKYSFNSRTKFSSQNVEIVLFFGFYLLTILIQSLAMLSLTGIGVSIWLAKILAIASGFFFSLSFKFFFVFGPSSEK